MENITPKKRKCPICKKGVKRENFFWPFCSERCKIIDLGNWASGAYRVLDKPNREEEAGEQNPKEKRTSK